MMPESMKGSLIRESVCNVESCALELWLINHWVDLSLASRFVITEESTD
jgi:hypothetical protein